MIDRFEDDVLRWVEGGAELELEGSSDKKAWKPLLRFYASGEAFLALGRHTAEHEYFRIVEVGPPHPSVASPQQKA